jgi:sugar/nucleoside kinase (ribokinase family)
VTQTGIICAGNWIVDIVHTIDTWPRKSDLVHIRDEVVGVGGGPANVALGLRAMGFSDPLFGVGLLGQDQHAQTVLDACQRARIDTRGLRQSDRAPTGHTHVMTVPGDSRTFFYHPGTNDLLDASDIPQDLPARVFYLGYINLLGTLDRIEPDGTTAAAKVLAQARAAGMFTCVDLVSSDTPDFARAVAASLSHIDMLFLNEVEAARATGLPISGGDDRNGIQAAARLLVAGGAGTVVIHTPALSLWLTANQPPLCIMPDPMDPATIISPVGAGDAFCAGVIYGIYHGWDPVLSMTLGHRAAAAALGGATATSGIPPLADLMR